MRIHWTAFAFVLVAFATLAVPVAQAYEPEQGEAVLYRSADCTGSPFMVVRSGEIHNDLRLRETSAGGQWEHATVCIHVGPNTRVTIFTKSDYRGVSLTLTRTSSNPAGVWTLGPRWNDDISSLKVRQ
jgi:hypothetical protein